MAGLVTPGAVAEDVELIAITLNVTSGPRIKELVGGHGSTAHVICIQEHRLDDDQLDEYRGWASARGWDLIASKSFIGPAGKASSRSAGVLLLASKQLGLIPLTRSSSVVEEGRAVMARITLPGGRSMLLASAYLRDGEGLSEANRGTLARIAQAAALEGAPLLLGADFNTSAAELLGSDIRELMAAEILMPEGGTCRKSAGGTSRIDGFLLSASLARAAKGVATCRPWDARPHWPVKLSFFADLPFAKYLDLAKPEDIPTVQLLGPRPPPPSWAPTLAALEAAKVEVAAGSALTVVSVLRHAYALVANDMEKELCGVTGTFLTKMGMRAKDPAYVWRDILPSGPPRVPPVQAARWVWGLFLDAKEAVRQTGTNLVLAGQLTDAALASLSDPPAEVQAHTAVVPYLRGLTADLEAICLSVRSGDSRAIAEAAHGFATNWQEAADDLQAMADDELEGGRVASSKAWRDWVKKGLERGSGPLHRYTKVPPAWRPTHTVSAKGKVLSDPGALLQQETAALAGVWRAVPGGGPPGRCAAASCPLHARGHHCRPDPGCFGGFCGPHPYTEGRPAPSPLRPALRRRRACGVYAASAVRAGVSMAGTSSSAAGAPSGEAQGRIPGHRALRRPAQNLDQGAA